MDTFSQGWALALISVGTIAIAANVSLLVVAKRSKSSSSIANILVLNLCLCDLGTLIANTPFMLQSAVLSSPSLLPDEVACQITGFLNLLLGSQAVLSIFLLALERYLTICVFYHKPRRWWILLMAFSWVCSTVLASAPLFRGFGFALQPSQLYCLVDLTRRRYTLKAILVIALNGIGLFLVFSYSRIFIKFARNRSNVRRFMNSPLNQSKNTIDTSSNADEESSNEVNGEEEKSSNKETENTIHHSHQALISSIFMATIVCDSDSSVSQISIMEDNQQSNDTPRQLEDKSQHIIEMPSTKCVPSVCPTSEVSRSQLRITYKLERMLAVRAVSICMTFFVSWSVFNWCLIHSLFSVSTPLQPWTDSLALLLMAFNRFLNPALTFALDRSFRVGLRNLLKR
ncbi:hypothetical protein BKA69DRAFT_1045113 [Paraphysoderma sedebokerense]|nr:hypothetical protein BKA69DRAFT_1045113 [Paraphysoderma sedebokerense]